MELDQAQEGRHRCQARPALLEALAGDHRRRQGGWGGSGGEPRAAERDREGALVLDAEGQHRARDRQGFRRRRGSGELRDGGLRGLRARRRRGSGRSAHGQSQSHGLGGQARIHEARRQPRNHGCRRVAVRATWRRAGLRGRCRRGRPRAGCGRGRRRRRGARRIELRRHESARVALRRPAGPRERRFRGRVGRARHGPEDDRRRVGRVDGPPDREARRGTRGNGGRPGRLRELRHPGGRARGGSLLADPVAIVAADTAGRRADRIEALLSARLFVEPHLADDRITFVSNLSGRLSLYAMDVTGGVPEPLLPPQIALQNPELVGGHLFHVVSGLGRIVVMIDADGDENYVPYTIPLEGGFPEPLAPETFAGGRSHLMDVDDAREIAYFAVESRAEASTSAVRVDLATRAAETLWQSSYGANVAAWTPDHSRVVLADGYTMGDVVLYEVDSTGARLMLLGTAIEDRDPDAAQPLTGLDGAHGTASG